MATDGRVRAPFGSRFTGRAIGDALPLGPVRPNAGIVGEGPHGLPPGDHSFAALNVAAIRKMVTAPNAGVAPPLGVPGLLWQCVAILMANDNGPTESWDKKETASRAREAVYPGLLTLGE